MADRPDKVHGGNIAGEVWGGSKKGFKGRQILLWRQDSDLPNLNLVREMSNRLVFKDPADLDILANGANGSILEIIWEVARQLRRTDIRVNAKDLLGAVNVDVLQHPPHEARMDLLRRHQEIYSGPILRCDREGSPIGGNTHGRESLSNWRYKVADALKKGIVHPSRRLARLKARKEGEGTSNNGFAPINVRLHWEGFDDDRRWAGCAQADNSIVDSRPMASGQKAIRFSEDAPKVLKFNQEVR